MKNIVQNSVENSVRNMVKGKRKQHGEKFLPTWRYCSAWGVPDEYTLVSLSKHKLTDSHTGHTHTPHWQQPLCTTHTHTFNKHTQDRFPALPCKRCRETAREGNVCRDMYLAQPKAISLYLLLTATQVPSVTSAAQTPCNCWTNTRSLLE